MTSPIEDITVQCPKCGHLYENWFHDDLAVPAEFAGAPGTGAGADGGGNRDRGRR